MVQQLKRGHPRNKHYKFWRFKSLLCYAVLLVKSS